jgi:hypothetical protein
MGVRWAALVLVVATACAGGGGLAGTLDGPGPRDLPALDAVSDAGAPDGGARPDLTAPDAGPDGSPGDPGADASRADAPEAPDEAPAEVAPDIAPDPAPDPAPDVPDDAPPDPGPDPAPDVPDDAPTDPAPDLPGDAGSDDGGDPGTGLLVNAVREGDQSLPSVAPRPGGGWWVAWQTRPPSGGDWQVAARCLGPEGAPASDEARVSSDACTAARRPAVAVADDGALWVAYEADGLDGDGSAVALRRWPSCGALPGPEWRMNAFASSYQGMPALAPLAGGTVVAAWQSECKGASACDWLDGSWSAVAHRRAGAAGPLGPGESVANRFTIGDQLQPALAAFPGGTWWVAWSGAMDIPSLYDVFVDRFDAAGARLGEDLPVNAATVGAQSVPRVAVLPGGGAVVAWMDWDAAGTASDLRLRVLDGTGTPASGDLALAADPVALESSSALAPAAGGGFRAAWRRREVAGGPGTVRWRAFDAGGLPAGDEGTASEGRDGDAGQPALAAGDDGRTLLVFTSSGRDGSGTGIVAVPLP